MKTISTKVFILFMFLTGFFQQDIINLDWEYLTSLRSVHVIGSIIISIVLIIPFANTHSYDVLLVKKRYNIDGFILGVILFLVIASGGYLFLVGNRGGDFIGKVSFYTHLFGAYLLVLALFYHIKKVRMMRNNISLQNKTFALILISIFVVFNPTVSFSEDKLSLIKLEEGVDRYHSEDWTNSAKCKSCHEDIFNQWANSNHKNLAGSNPYYMVSEALAEQDMGKEFRQWCMSCHNPSAVTTKQKATSHGMNGNFLANEIFEKDGETLLKDFKNHGNFRLEEGVSCVACHRIQKVNEKGNGDYSLNLQDRKKYSYEDSKSKIGQWLGEKFINSKPQVHKESYSKELYKDPRYCASCHNEFTPLYKNLDKKYAGKKIVATYDEWKNSPFNNPKDSSKHKTCIDCHMTNMSDGEFSPLKGRSTTGGKIKKDIKVHYFSGANHFLSGLKSKEHEKQTIALLKTSAKLDMEFVNNKLKVGVKNVGAGHHLPTGVADFRQLWLDIQIEDKHNNIIFSSGKLDKDGNLDKKARIFMKVFGDKNNKPVGLLFWRYEKLLSDTRIPAGKRKIEIFDIKDKNIKYPIKVTVKLNFRIYPQWITNAVQKAYPALPNPPVLELNKIQKVYKNDSSK